MMVFKTLLKRIKVPTNQMVIIFLCELLILI